jgi:hypothetical protein
MLSARRRDSSSIPAPGLAATIDEIISTCRRRATRMHCGFYLPTRAPTVTRDRMPTLCPTRKLDARFGENPDFRLATRGRADLFANRYTQDRISNREAFGGAITWPAIPSESEPHNLLLTARVPAAWPHLRHRYGTPNEATQCRRNAGKIIDPHSF